MAALAISVIGGRTLALLVRLCRSCAIGLVLVLVMAKVLLGGAAGFVRAVRCH